MGPPSRSEHRGPWLAVCGLHAAGLAWAAAAPLPTGWGLWSSVSPLSLSVWTCAWSHLSPAHAGANAAVLGALAALGWFGRARPRWALAWLLAWPATALGLLAWAQPLSLQGLSGVLHAGLAVLALGALLDPPASSGQAPRWAAVLAAGLVLKLGWEQAWVHPVVLDGGWGFAVSRAAHLSGTAVGGVSLLALLGLGVAGRGLSRR